MMSIANWIAKYKQSTNEDFFLPPNYTLMTNHEHGFVMYRVCGETMWVTQCCGHQWYWYPIMETIAKAFGCKQFKTFTSYSPTGSKTFELQYKTSSVRSNEGLGIAASFGEDEIYTVVDIIKVA